jgi:hypothetical protein
MAAILSQYNSSATDLPQEIKFSKTNLLENSKQSTKIQLDDNITMLNPEWNLPILSSLINEMVKTENFNTKYDYLPDKLSFDMYGTHELWQILMHINGANTRIEFIGPELKFIDTWYIPRLLDILKFGRNRVEKSNLNTILRYQNLTIKEVLV